MPQWDAMAIPGGFSETVHPVEEIVAAVEVARLPVGMSTRVVAIDGHGGSGKSSLAAVLSEAMTHAPIVHTDDFASWDNPIEWWPRLLDQALVPLASGEAARYQRFDWIEKRLAEWIDLPPRPAVVIVEGVSASRFEFDPYLAFRIWVETSRATCLRRGLERDGEAMRGQWSDWFAEEDAYVARDDPVGRADLIVSGEPASTSDPTQVAVLEDRGHVSPGQVRPRRSS